MKQKARQPTKAELKRLHSRRPVVVRKIPAANESLQFISKLAHTTKDNKRRQKEGNQ